MSCPDFKQNMTACHVKFNENNYFSNSSNFKTYTHFLLKEFIKHGYTNFHISVIDVMSAK